MRTKHFKVEYYLFGETVNIGLRNGTQAAKRILRHPEIPLKLG
jgi:hypothetical protein